MSPFTFFFKLIFCILGGICLFALFIFSFGEAINNGLGHLIFAIISIVLLISLVSKLASDSEKIHCPDCEGWFTFVVTSKKIITERSGTGFFASVQETEETILSCRKCNYQILIEKNLDPGG